MQLSKKKSISLDNLLKNNSYESYISKIPYSEQTISKVHISDEGEVDACILADDEDTVLFITLRINASGSERVLLDMFLAMRETVQKYYGRFEVVRFFAEDNRLPALLENSVGNADFVKKSVITQNAIRRVRG